MIAISTKVRTLTPCRLAVPVVKSQQAWYLLHHHLLVKRDTLNLETFDTRNIPVSICVTHYERPKLLLQTLKALTMQTHKNLQVIVIDDGSTSNGTQYLLQTEVMAVIKAQDWEFMTIPNSYPQPVDQS
jgi:hypothetical protein